MSKAINLLMMRKTAIDQVTQIMTTLKKIIKSSRKIVMIKE